MPPTPPLPTLGLIADLRRRLLAAVGSALVLGLAYALPVAFTVDYPSPVSGQPALGIVLGLWLAAPAAAWALLRWIVHALVLSLRYRGESAAAIHPSFGTLLREAVLGHACVVAAAVAAFDAYLGVFFFSQEREAHPFAWLSIDAAVAIAAIAALALALRPLAHRPEPALRRAVLIALAVLLTLNGILGIAVRTTRAAAPRGAAEDGPPRTPTGLRVIVVGIDGASWNVLDDMIADGDMPNLRSLLARGARGALLSEAPFESPTVWTTIATGRSPAEHGVLGYITLQVGFCAFSPEHALRAKWLYPFRCAGIVANILGQARLQPVTASFRRADALWEILSRQGRTTNTVNWIATYPADPIRGVVVGDAWFKEWLWVRFPIEPDRPLVHPPEVAAEIAPLCPPPEQYDIEQFRDYGDLAPRDWEILRMPMRQAESTPVDLVHLKWGTAVDENVFRTAMYLTRRRPAELTMVLSGLEDLVSHYFNPYRWPERFDHLHPELLRRHRGIVNAHHRRMDRQLGEWSSMVDSRTVLLVVSDHGFEMLRDNPLTPEAHAPEGIILAAGGPVRAGVAALHASIYDIAPTVLYLLGATAPAGLRGRVLTEFLEESFVRDHPPVR